MYRSKLLEEENRLFLERSLLANLSSNDEFTNIRVINSPRAVGDIVEELIKEEFARCVPAGLLENFNSAFARRAMADFAFNDIVGNYFRVDVKTHNKSTSFNMPNLTSVERLSRFYEDDANYFMILFVEYEILDDRLAFAKISFRPIEHFKWSCLTIGALGWGQIQIANANSISFEDSSRRRWMLELCDALELFYPKEIDKIVGRLERFREVRKFWESKA